MMAKHDENMLHKVLKAICLSPGELRQLGGSPSPEDLKFQLCSLLVLARESLIPRSNWIDLCLRVELDPGELTRTYEDQLLRSILDATGPENKVKVARISPRAPQY